MPKLRIAKLLNATSQPYVPIFNSIRLLNLTVTKLLHAISTIIVLNLDHEDI